MHGKISFPRYVQLGPVGPKTKDDKVMARTFVQQSQISGSLAYVDNLAAGEGLAYKPTLDGDLDALRSQVNKIIGKTNWFEALDGSQDLADIYEAVHMSGADADFQGTLDVTGVATFDSAITGSAGLKLAGDLDVNSSADFQGAVNLQDTLTVAQAADLNGSLDVAGQVDLAATGVATTVRGTFNVDEVATFDAAITGSAGLQLAGDLDVNSSADFQGAVNLQAALTVAGAADFNGGVTADHITIDGDVAGHLYFVDPSTGEVQDSADLRYESATLFVTGAVEISQGLNVLDGGLTVAGDKLEITGSFALLGDAAIDGDIFISGDVAERLYIVDGDGSIKDEAKLTFDGSELWIDGDLEVAGGDITMSNSMSISSATAGKLLLTGDVVETSADLRVGGNTIKSSTADAIELDGADVEVKGDLQVSGNDISDSGAATVLSFKTLDSVDHSVEVANNMEVKGDMLRAVSGSFSGDLTVAGDLVIQGAMTYIDTENLKVKDTLIHLNVGGTSNLSPRGIVLHGDQAYDDLAFGAKPASGDFVFAMNVSDADVDAGNSDVFDSAKLAALWMGEVKLGGQEGSLSGSLAATAAGVELGSTAELSVQAADDLLLSANGETAISFIESGEYAAFNAQFPGSSLVAAIVAAGGNFKQDSFLPGVVAANAAIDFAAGMGATLRAASVVDAAAKKLAMDVYLNGVRLAYTEDYIIHSTTEIKLTMATMSDDRLLIAVHNAA
jgi:cytoskeletal protein CcmA (bactofilin family)